MRNDRDDFAQRLYARLPEVYRSRDLEIARQRVAPTADDSEALNSAPLFGLVRAIAGQVASVRQDMDDLWDNFFIETCDDWVVPYLGALVGTRLLVNPVGQSNRLDVRNTVRWRRSKGTPAMLAGLAGATTGWGVDLSEFFSSLGWSQNLNHARPGRDHDMGLVDPYLVSRVGHADDTMAHLVDLRAAADLDAPPTSIAQVGRPPMGTAGGGTETAATPGRYLPPRVGSFIRRLSIFPMRGVTPAVDAADSSRYTFDPLAREVPLYSRRSHAPISRAELQRFPATFFGSSEEPDIAIRRDGVLLASPRDGRPSFSRSERPFTFGTPAAGLKLDPLVGLRLLQGRDFERHQEHFIVTALWRTAAGDQRLGALNTLRASQGDQAGGFRADAPVGAAGRLVIRIQTGAPDPSLGWNTLPVAGPGRFPATVIAIRDELAFPRSAPAELGGPALSPDSIYKDALLIYLPAMLVRPGAPVDLLVADDGSTYWAAAGVPSRASLARLAEGQVWPAADTTHPSAVPVLLASIHRRSGLVIPDPGAFSNNAPPAGQLSVIPVPVMIRIYLDGDLRGALATAAIAIDDVARATYAFPPGSTNWPAMSFVATRSAMYPTKPDVPARVELRITSLATPADQGFVAQAEVIVRDRGGRSLLVYLPEISFVGSAEHRFAVAEDGSTYRTEIPSDDPDRLPDAGLARIGLGQILWLEGVYPKQRRVIATGRPRPGEIWIDPEHGRLRLMPSDPLLAIPPAGRMLSVDFVDAFSDRTGARAFDREIDYGLEPPSRLVSASGDAATALPIWRIHRSLGEAIAAAANNPYEIIEIADSATYTLNATINADPVRRWVIRAANEPNFERPCLVGPGGQGIALHVQGSPRAGEIEFNGLFLSAGGIRVDGSLNRLRLTACSLDPASAAANGSLVLADTGSLPKTECIVCRCITGALRLGPGVTRLVAADSIIDLRGGLAVGGLGGGSGTEMDPAARHVQLERVTVLGRVRAETLLASESLLTDVVKVDDRQAGCLRFSRYEPSGPDVPRRYRCVPSDQSLAAGDAATAVFNSLTAARPEYAQLAGSSSPLVLTASEAGDQVGAFAASFPGLRLANLHAKLAEFLPAGLDSVIIAET